MPKTVLLDEWHITLRIPAVLSDADVRAVHRILSGKAFTVAVRRAVVDAVRERVVLKPVRLTLGR